MGCGLAAVCGVAGLLDLISVFVALSGDVDEFFAAVCFDAGADPLTA